MQKNYLSKLRHAEYVTKQSIYSLIAIMVLKVGAFYLTDMLILLTSALKTLTAVMSLFAAWIGIKASKKAADKNFEYGYYKVETFAAFVASCLVMYLGIRIIIASIEEIQSPVSVNYGFIGLVIILFAILFSWKFANLLEDVAKEANLSSLEASARYNQIDSLAYIGILLGAVMSIIGVPYIEPIISGMIALGIIWIAGLSIRNALYSLLDYWHDHKMLKDVRAILNGQSKIVKKIEQIKLRQAGPLIFGESILQVNPFANTKDVRDAIDTIKSEVLKLSPYFQDFSIYTHVVCQRETLIAIPIKKKNGLKSLLAHRWANVKSILIVSVKNNKAKVKSEILYNDKKITHQDLANMLVKEKVNVFMWSHVDSLMYYTLDRIHQIQIYPSFSNAKTVEDAVKMFSIDA